MDQTFEPLNADDIADLEAKRAWVREHYDEGARHKYDTLDGKLRLLDTILRNKWITPDQTLSDPALTVEGTSVRVFPLTSISKRIERGEEVEIYALFADVCNAIERLKREGA